MHCWGISLDYNQFGLQIVQCRPRIQMKESVRCMIHNHERTVKDMQCVNVFMLFASLPKLHGDKHWIICSAADLIIHSDDLIMSIRQTWAYFFSHEMAQRSKSDWLKTGMQRWRVTFLANSVWCNINPPLISPPSPSCSPSYRLKCHWQRLQFI